MARTQAVQQVPGMIEAGAIYSLDEFKSRVGWSHHACRTARRNGLRVLRTAGRAYVAGSDFFAYIAKVCEADAPCNS